MWWTQKGERVLMGAEATLFREALGYLWDEIEMCEQIDEDHRVGVKAFDNLSVGQKLAMLVQVGEALLDAAVAVPELTAVNEATVAAVFAQLAINIELELDDPAMDRDWRRLVVDACSNLEIDDLPDSDCEDLDEWQLWIDCLADQILWDADYEADHILDDPPELRRVMTSLMGTTEQYHTVLAGEPRVTDIAGLKHRLRAVVRG